MFTEQIVGRIRSAMPGFTFGTPSATSAPMAEAGALLGSTTAAKPLFGATTSAAPTTQAPTLFGAPTATSTSTGGLFGTTASTSTAPTGSLFGTNATTASTPATGTLFGSTATKSLFGSTLATSSATSTGGLFGKPTTGGLFGTTGTMAPLATSTTGGIFGASAASVTTAPTGGLGGSGTFTLGGATTGIATTTAVGVAGAAASSNPMDGEVPKPLLDLITQLKDQIKSNRELSDEFVMNSNDSCITMDGKLDDVKKKIVKETSDVRKARLKATVLLEKVERDARAAEQLQRRHKEMAKAQRYGRNHAIDYLQATCSEYETMVAKFNETLRRVEAIISDKLNRDPNKSRLTYSDLMMHLKRFDQVFKVIASDVFQCNQQVQEAKEALLEYRRKTMPYAPNPFEKKLDTVQNAVALSKFTGAEAFPSQVTMMKIGELARAATPAQPTGFGTTGSMFGAKPLGATPFSFSTPSSSGTTGSLFKPFSTPSTSTTTPLFGSTTASTAGAPPAAPIAASSFTFGNTLNSSVSGTLFGGSASKPLFGK
ncbi:putative nucleoporin Nup58 [Toxocara canis]|uniref:Putative nucleoporin Nup58 n=1 Tax=Toxocara canis TaxID=6265 RepID=A0A0B2VTA9_TOXCA|nr:putative nucleoporin Nup58 [Toxocara canis]